MSAATGERRLAVVSAGCFAVSLLFPVAASLPIVDPSLWLGIVDVSVAAVMVVLAFVVYAKGHRAAAARDHAASFAVVRSASVAILVFLVLYLWGGWRLRWEVLMTGLGWRSWLLVQALPSWMVCHQSSQAVGLPPPGQKSLQDRS